MNLFSALDFKGDPVDSARWFLHSIEGVTASEHLCSQDDCL